MTEYGLKCLQRVEACGLARFYQEHVGNIIIPECDFTPAIYIKVFAFLRNNPNWVFGYENPNGDCGYYWLNTIDTLRTGV